MTETKTLMYDGSPEDAVLRLVEQLLKSGEVDSVFGLRETDKDNRYCYSLISSPQELKKLRPFLPVMPVQGARALTALTISSSLQRPIAALVRPCELRAFIENVKQAQGDLKNIRIISCTCSGVVPADELTDEVLQAPEDHIRPACSRCVLPVPDWGADITVLLAADEKPECAVLYLNSRWARESLKPLQGFESGTFISPKQAVAGMIHGRERARKTTLGSTSETGLSGLVSMFSACIGCRACREACPLCNCILCDYETARTIMSPRLVQLEASRRGALRVPAGTLQFQLGRLMHIAPLCVSCGQCSDVCPVDIPVAEIFTRAGDSVQETLNYIPGMDMEDETPMSTYRQDELQEITD